MKNPAPAILLLLGAFAPVFAQPDTVPPVLVCNPIYFFSPTPICYAEIQVEDLIESVTDNAPGTVMLGMRKSCSGTGFPENAQQLYFNEGFTHVDVWARDSAGNTTSTIVKVYVHDSGFCDPAFFFEPKTTTDQWVLHSNIVLKGSNCVGDTFRTERTLYSSAYYYFLGWAIPDIGYDATATPSKTINPSNGVTTYDLVLISKHILGIAPISSPYKLIAADANFDGAVTTADIVLLRQLILGIIPELPHKQSWRFVRKDYQFPNPANPFVPPFPDRYYVKPADTALPGQFYFTGVKIGDVNDSADPNN